MSFDEKDPVIICYFSQVALILPIDVDDLYNPSSLPVLVAPCSELFYTEKNFIIPLPPFKSFNQIVLLGLLKAYKGNLAATIAHRHPEATPDTIEHFIQTVEKNFREPRYTAAYRALYAMTIQKKSTRLPAHHTAHCKRLQHMFATNAGRFKNVLQEKLNIDKEASGAMGR